MWKLRRRGIDSETAGVFPGNLLAGRSFEDLRGRLEREYVQYHLRRLGGDADALGEFMNLKRTGITDGIGKSDNVCTGI